MVVDVAVEHFVPVTGAWKADCVAVVVEGLFAQAYDDDYVAAYARAATGDRRERG